MLRVVRVFITNAEKTHELLHVKKLLIESPYYEIRTMRALSEKMYARESVFEAARRGMFEEIGVPNGNVLVTNEEPKYEKIGHKEYYLYDAHATLEKRHDLFTTVEGNKWVHFWAWVPTQSCLFLKNSGV